VSGGIYLIRDGDQLVEMTEQLYSSEEILQSLLAQYPNLLAGDQMDSDSPRRWLLVSREMALPSDELEGGRWSVDHLFLDQEGIPTLVEVKRSSDTRLRREVVGQLLEYAANAVLYWPVERIAEEFLNECERQGSDPDEQLQDVAGSDVEADTFWDRVRTNLQAGRVRLVFVADVVPRELRRIVEFLNEQMAPADVFALEVKQFTGGGLTTLVPRLIGATERKPSPRSTGQRRHWSEEEFFAQLESGHGTAIADASRKLLTGLRGIEGVEIWWGQGMRTGSLTPWILKGAVKYQFFTLYSARARIEFSFGVLKNRPEFESAERREELRCRLNALDGFDIPPEGIEKWPSLPVEPLLDDENRKRFVGIIEWLVEEIYKT